MKNLLKSSLLIFFLTMVSCKPSPQKAENYYDDIIKPIDAVFEKEDELISLINNEMDKSNNDSSSVLLKSDTSTYDNSCKKIDMAFNNFQFQIITSINKLEFLPDFDNSNNLKISAIDLLNEYDNICKNEYDALIKIVKIPTENYTIENDNKFMELSEIIDNRLQGKMTVLLKELKLFANKYNFEIQNDSIKK